mmetsp:Transcript_15812/g.50329  ORF Transcript_15812/g.50329 Transcript_15812/m.50329 type:complete len:472 (-) Transcript_15812:191-1606(-)
MTLQRSVAGSGLREPLLQCSASTGRLPGGGAGADPGCTSPPSRGRRSGAPEGGSSPLLPAALRHAASARSIGLMRPEDTRGTDENIRVYVRVRPREKNEERAIFEIEENRTVRFSAKARLLSFSFDQVLGESATQQQTFELVASGLVESCMEGYNGSICVYGQTGAGKTFTMFGPTEHRLLAGSTYGWGLVQRSLEFFFAQQALAQQVSPGEQQYTLQCSFLEIYREQISDLLEPSSTNLQLREDSNLGVYVEGLAKEDVGCLDHAMQVLRRGLQQRKVAATRMNERSSRSHAVFTVAVRRQADGAMATSSLSFVDLAGAERQLAPAAAAAAATAASRPAVAAAASAGTASTEAAASAGAALDRLARGGASPSTSAPSESEQTTAAARASEAPPPPLADAAAAAVGAAFSLSRFRFFSSFLAFLSFFLSFPDADEPPDEELEELPSWTSSAAAESGTESLPSSPAEPWQRR